MPDLLRGELRRPPAYSTVGACRAQTGGSSLPNKVALHFGKRRHDMEKEPSGRCGGIYAVGQADEVDARVFQFGDQFDELPHGPPKAVQLPDYEAVTAAKMRPEVLQPRPVASGAAAVLSEYAIAPGALERLDLQVQALVASGNASVADQHAQNCRKSRERLKICALSFATAFSVPSRSSEPGGGVSGSAGALKTWDFATAQGSS